MKLASALSAHFDNDVRARGASYYRLGAVRIKRGNESSVAAGVRGSRVYDVEISWDGRHLMLFCDCPYYAEVGGCKHIWATILAADAQNYFTAITRLNSRDVSFDESPREEDDEEFDQPHYYAPPTHALPAPKPPLQVVPPAWKQRLSEIVPAGSLARTVWPAQQGTALYRRFAFQHHARGADPRSKNARAKTQGRLEETGRRASQPRHAFLSAGTRGSPHPGAAFRHRNQLRLDGLRHIRIV